MVIIEMCPKCRHNLLDSVIDVMPPIHKKECPHCGWSWAGKPEKVIRVPFGGVAPIHFETLAIAASDSETIAGLLDNFEYRPKCRPDILKKYDLLIKD